jgi:carbonic anhydrase
MLDYVLNANKDFTQKFEPKKMSFIPQKKLCIVTCMDTRLTGFLEDALGIGRGDAKIIKNAGNTNIDRDVVRSVAISIFLLEVEEVMVIGHTECGMANIKPEKLEKSMISLGISSDEIKKIDLKEWIGSIDNEESNVINVVEKIKNSPFIPDHIPIHGLIIDIENGALKVLVDSR